MGTGVSLRLASKKNLQPPLEKFQETLAPQATQFVEDAADFYSAKCALDNGLCRKQLVERMQVALLQEVGKRLLVGLQAAAEEGL